MYLIILIILILIVSIVMLIVFKKARPIGSPNIILMGNRERVNYFQYKLSSLYNIKTISNYDDLYKIDIQLYDCIVNLDCDNKQHVSYIIRNRVPLLNLVYIGNKELLSLVKKWNSSLIYCRYLTEGYLELYEILEKLKKTYSYKEEILKDSYSIILNNGLERINIDFNIEHEDAYLNNIIDNINILLSKRVKNVF